MEEINHPKPSLLYEFNFEDNDEGWIFGYSDYPINLSLNDSVLLYEMQYSYSFLPSNIFPPQKGLRIKGSNRSDDLFMFIKKKITGLSPNTLYKISYELEIASNVPSNSFGIGGSPGEALVIKVGAKWYEPLNTIDYLNYYRLNIDKGNQSLGGSDMIVVGDIGVDDNTTEYTLINRNNLTSFSATTNKNGDIWIIIGTDSGFEGLTELYYSNIEIQFEKQ